MIGKMKKGKAPGRGNISLESIKYGGRKVILLIKINK
jgi:hypothetical protein